MMDDELQVLGTERTKKKYNKVAIAVIALAVVIAIVGGVFYVTSTKQPEKIETGKKIGDATILPELQKAIDSLLTAKLTEINGLQGQAIVMEVQTGEILAMVGLDPNFEGKYQPCKNFAYQQEPGALTQTISLLALLETGKVNLSDVVDTGCGIWEADNGWIIRDHNWRNGGYELITMDKALEVSSNIGISKTIWEIFKGHEQNFYNILDSMSYGQPSSIDGIDGLSPAYLNSPKDSDWVDKNILWCSIGYNQQIAPIQMLTFYNAIANNGKMVKPTLTTGETDIINPQIASKATISSIQLVLEHVVSQGLGRRADTPKLKVAGKTGTTVVGEYCFGGEYCVDEYQVSFCGYFPAFEPKYSIIVSMNKLGIPVSGGGMAAPVFRQITEWMITHDMLTKE